MTDDGSVKNYAEFVLPSNVVTRVDVSHVVSELERVDNDITTATVRAQLNPQEVTRPAMSQQLTAFLEQNHMNLDNSQARSEIIKQLRLLKDKVPVIHMTFAVTADGESLATLTQWVRNQVHPQAVIDVGLQPALVGGVYVRTPNHIHDWSLRAKLHDGHDILVKELESFRGAK
jgi:F0F1-type ATP synthase delta subunit